MRERTDVRLPIWRRRRLWWLVAVVVVVDVLQICCVVGPDPRYLLIYDGMPRSHVDWLMGKADYYDTWGDDDRPAHFYCYNSTEIIVEFDAQDNVCKKHFLGW